MSDLPSYAPYSQMQRACYDNTGVTSESLVGNWDWHEQFPYETFLLYPHGDIRKPVIGNLASRRVLDFGCGPGRMLRRMAKLFRQVDGCDISQRLLEEARVRMAGTPTELFLTSGNDLGAAPLDTYDFIYSTITLQHVAVHAVRQHILRAMAACLRPGGCVTLQFGFTRNSFPDVSGGHTRWGDDRGDASGTNGQCDVVITPEDLPAVRADFEVCFQDTRWWFFDCAVVRNDLNGTVHGPYWATHWLFVNAVRRALRTD